MFIYRTIHEAYLGTLKDVLNNPDCISAPRGLPVNEKFNYMFKVTEPKVEAIITNDPERNKVIASYTAKEMELYGSGTNLASEFGKASKFWLSLANPDGTINSGYGYNIKVRKSYGSDFETELVEYDMYNHNDPDCMGKMMRSVPVRRTPFEYCVEALKRDKDTRQAVLQFAHPSVFWFGNKDVCCTLNGLFSIRANRLNFLINMRSNDMMLGLVFDISYFISLMYDMASELKSTYPELEVGEYTHFVNNIHIYEKDREKVLKMIG